MTHGEPHAPGHAPAPAPGVPFPEAEWQRLQAEDRFAARMVVGLMVAIFSIGVVLYTIVALSAAS